MIPTKYQGACWILIAAFSYSTVALFGKWAFLLQIPVGALLSWRFAIAAVVFWILFRFQKPIQLPPDSKRNCFFLGLFGDATRTTLFFIAIQRLGASLSALLLYTFPLFVFLIQKIIFKKPATRVQWLGLILSSLGCLFAVAPSEGSAFAFQDSIGVLAGIGAGIAEASYICCSGQLTKNVPAAVATSYVSRGALLSFCLIALCLGQLQLPSTSQELTLAFCLALFATVIPIFCLMKGVKSLGATQTSLIFTIEPVITIALAIVLFDESLTFSKIIGSALILGSSVLVQKKSTPQPVAQGDTA